MIKYFDFEKPIEKIDEQLIELEKDKDKNKKTIEQLKNQKEKLNAQNNISKRERNP